MYFLNVATRKLKNTYVAPLISPIEGASLEQGASDSQISMCPWIICKILLKCKSGLGSFGIGPEILYFW